jgi:hypothetical protein
MANSPYLLWLQRTADLEHDRGRGIDLIAGEQRALWQDEVHAGCLHAIDAANGSGQFTFQCSQVIDVLDEGRCTERIGLVENLVADSAALGQSGFGKLHAQPGDLVLGHHDDGAVALELVGNGLPLQILDDRRAVVDREVGK